MFMIIRIKETTRVDTTRKGVEKNYNTKQN